VALRNTIGEIPAGLAVDAQALAGLREQAKTAPAAALKTAATQFEGLFMSMVLKSMRDAMPKDGMFQSDTTRTYTDMLDQQLAMTLAKKGTGLSDVIVRQLSQNAAVDPSQTKTDPAATGAGGAAQQPAPGGAPAARRPTSSAASSRVSLNEKIQGFLDTMRPHAQAASQATGLPANFLIGQAALETGWGKSVPKATDGTVSHNLFGIKAGANWKGATVDAVTTEYVNGKATKVVQKFRAYDSYTEAFADFARVMRGNSRYAQVLAKGNDAAAYAQGLQRAGYATDPQYAQKLQKVIERTLHKVA
jgi:peptidoglycan hydrolase FlgJ